ncbi:MAG: hypothetical protein QOE01_896, partial [Actinomycetota bacterium]|nr:hypothetical protein [Actinomycetota bacterium]
MTRTPEPAKGIAHHAKRRSLVTKILLGAAATVLVLVALATWLVLRGRAAENHLESARAHVLEAVRDLRTGKVDAARVQVQLASRDAKTADDLTH